jgi:predicted nucleic acid-binding protein
MIFVDTWAWVALAVTSDQYHGAAKKERGRLKKKRLPYVTTNFVLGEVITHLYRKQRPAEAQAFINAILEAAAEGKHRLVELSSDQFRRAWQMRQKYHDKPDISFVDFTSMVVMQDLGITDVFTGDAHFQQVNLGFHLHP